MNRRIPSSHHPQSHPERALVDALRRHRDVLASAFWAVIVLGGIAFFFWLIWDPPI
jgi:hypothetical protein